MKTDDLIRALASDSVTETPGVRAMALRTLPVATIVTGAAFMVTLGLRTDMFSGAALAATAMKLVVTLAVAAAAVSLTLRLARSHASGSLAAPVAVIGPLALALFIAGDLVLSGVAGWRTRMIGSNGLFCLVMVPLLSLLPLAALMRILQAGAVTRPVTAGFVAGIAAAGIGASIYALHCTDDSPLFLALWYGLAVIVVSGVSAGLAHRLLRW